MKAPLVSILLISQSPFIYAQTDNFDDGNSAGWTELAPLAGVGGTGSFSFPGGNSYRMQAGASPNQDALGPSRIGALREDVTYTDFYMSIDLVTYDQALDQNIGMLARVKEPGLASLDGYSVTYNPTDQRMFFTVITDEEGDNLIDEEVLLDPGTPVRLVFRAVGDLFTCEVFELSDLTAPVATMEFSDSTYASGTSGIFVAADENDPPNATDCTFDNYFAASEAPAVSTEASIVRFEIEGDEFVIEFTSRAGESYGVWNSLDLELWLEVEDSIAGDIGPTTVARIFNPEPGATKQFFEVRKE